MKIFKVWLYEDASPVILPTFDAIGSLCEDCEIGDKIKIEVQEMAEDTFKSLPEWAGP